MHKQTLLFLRRDAASQIAAFATLTLSGPDVTTPEYALQQLKNAVAEWCLGTASGQRCTEYAGGEPNVGDIACYVDDEALLSAFKKWGFALDECHVNHGEAQILPCQVVLPYDKPLYSTSENNE